VWQYTLFSRMAWAIINASRTFSQASSCNLSAFMTVTSLLMLLFLAYTMFFNHFSKALTVTHSRWNCFKLFDMQNCQHQDMDNKIKKYRQAMFKLDHRGKSHKASASRALTASAIVMTLVTQCARPERYGMGLSMHLSGQSWSYGSRIVFAWNLQSWIRICLACGSSDSGDTNHLRWYVCMQITWRPKRLPFLRCSAYYLASRMWSPLRIDSLLMQNNCLTQYQIGASSLQAGIAWEATSSFLTE